MTGLRAATRMNIEAPDVTPAQAGVQKRSDTVWIPAPDKYVSGVTILRGNDCRAAVRHGIVLVLDALSFPRH